MGKGEWIHLYRISGQGWGADAQSGPDSPVNLHGARKATTVLVKLSLMGVHASLPQVRQLACLLRGGSSVALARWLL